MARNRQAGRGRMFRVPKHLEDDYASKLRAIARNVGKIILSHVGEDGVTLKDIPALEAKISKYEEAVGAWARAYVPAMLTKISERNIKDWVELANQQSRVRKFAVVTQDKREGYTAKGRQIRDLLKSSKTTDRAHAIVQEQIKLIKSLPTKSLSRATTLAHEAVINSERVSAIRDEIADTAGVTESRADLIARTEIARANASFTQANAEIVGATHYIWRTVDDEAVRESHDEVNGDVFSFSDPPTLSDGMTGNPGEFPNCRCYSEPIFSDE